MFYTPPTAIGYYPNYVSSASNAIINSSSAKMDDGAQIYRLYKEQFAGLHEEMSENKDIKLIRSHKNLIITSI